MGAVVGTVKYDRIAGYPQFVQQVEKLTDMHVMLDHPVRVFVLT